MTLGFFEHEREMNFFYFGIFLLPGVNLIPTICYYSAFLCLVLKTRSSELSVGILEMYFSMCDKKRVEPKGFSAWPGRGQFYLDGPLKAEIAGKCVLTSIWLPVLPTKGYFRGP